jgi:RNA-dependent RNA polymerase
MNPFHSKEHGRVDAAGIRETLGDFSGVLKQPAKYAARMAQAFTATDPAVKISRDQWEEVDDLGTKPYLHTDGSFFYTCYQSAVYPWGEIGVGTISIELAERIWAKLCEDRPGLLGHVTPSCVCTQHTHL